MDREEVEPTDPSYDYDKDRSILFSFASLTTLSEEEAIDLSSRRAYLLVFGKYRLPEMHPVGDEMLIGRSAHATVCLEDESVSRRHATIRRLEDGNFVLTDLDGQHGTRVNGREIKEHRLSSGELLQFGKGKAVFITFRNIFEELLIQLQLLNAEGRWAAGTALICTDVLSTLDQWLEVLQRAADAGSADPELLSSVVSKLQRVARRQQSLIAQLREVAQIQSFNERRVDMRELLYSLVNQITFPAHRRVTLQTEFDADIWIPGDPELLRQMMMELCTNAIEAMPRGGKLTIEARVVRLDSSQVQDMPFLRPGSNLRIKVSDTGKGLPPKIRRHVWEPFSSTKPSPGGFGLGLTKVFRIVRCHLGHIDLESTVGKGTTFTIHLPLLTPAY
jgi:signal transduction histidine kinase